MAAGTAAVNHRGEVSGASNVEFDNTIQQWEVKDRKRPHALLLQVPTCLPGVGTTERCSRSKPIIAPDGYDASHKTDRAQRPKPLEKVACALGR